MAIFGRITARQRLRRATRESLTVPAFSSPIDCTPWVTGGLWPAELSPTDPQTATVAEYLKADLEKIARSANDELKVIKRSGLSDVARQAEEARVIDDARARAVRRVESTVRQLDALRARSGTEQTQAPERSLEPDPATTHVMPAITDSEPGAPAPAEAEPRRWRAAKIRPDDVEPAVLDDDNAGVHSPAAEIEDTQVIPAVTDSTRAAEVPAEAVPDPDQRPDSGRHSAAQGTPVVPGDEPEAPARHRDVTDTAEAPPMRETTGGKEPDIDRLNRLLEFVVRQEPRLNWAVADRVDGTTVVVTDLAHGWIPPGIALPAGVRLLEPGRRTGKASALMGETTLAATYAPGDSLRRSADFAATKSSLQPRELSPVDDLGAVLSTATHWRDGLPGMVHAMASSAAAGARIVDQEVDVLRVHLDTARYQLLVQYPNADSALLLNCLLLAATEAFVIGDRISANYHLRWFQTLDASTPS